LTLSSRLDKIEKALPPSGVMLDKILNFLNTLDDDGSIGNYEMIEFRNNLERLGKPFLIIDEIFDVMPPDLRQRICKQMLESQKNNRP
jgi:hypothetical protein